MIGHEAVLPLRRRIGTTLVVASAALAGGVSAGEADDTEVLAKVRKAVGWDSALPLVIEGEAELYGSKGRLTLETGSAGKFRERIEAPLGRTRGDDGVTGWEVDSSGMPRRLEADERDRARLTTWIWTGQWLDPAAKLVATLMPRQPDGGDVILEVGFADCRWRAELLIDGQTWLPRSLTSTGASGSEVVEYSRYIEHKGRKLAGRIASRTGDIPTFIGNVTAVRSSPTINDRDFAPTERRPDDTDFDRTRPAKVRLERARTGQLLVFPTIDGMEPGAFVLDSGASGTVISPDVAAKLGLPALGVVPLGSMFGTVAAKVHRAASLRLGPATIKGVFLVEMDLAPLAAAFGVPVQGIVGYDLFSRACVDLTLADDALALYDPKSQDLDGLRWLPLGLPMRHPAVTALAAGVPEGQFRLDLGAAGGPAGNLIFHGSTVKKYHHLDGRQITRVQAGKLHLGVGQIDWFALAGHRFERPQVLFALDADGVLGEASTLGNIGVEFLKPFRIVFDYSRARVSFVELKKAD
jgi:hypothetical protein